MSWDFFSSFLRYEVLIHHLYDSTRAICLYVCLYLPILKYFPFGSIFYFYIHESWLNLTLVSEPKKYGLVTLKENKATRANILAIIMYAMNSASKIK